MHNLRLPRVYFIILVVIIGVSFGYLLFQNNDNLVSEENQEEETSENIPGQYIASPVCDLDVSFNVDVSASMLNVVDGKTKLDWAKEAMNAFVSRMEDLASSNSGYNIKIGVAEFSYRRGNDARIVQSLTNDFGRVTSAVNSIQRLGGLFGGTCISCGIAIANNDFTLNSHATKKAQIVFSDGCGNKDILNRTIPVSEGRINSTYEANRGRSQGIIYYTVGYSSEAVSADCGNPYYDEQTLLEIAGDPSRHYFRPNASDWVNTFEELALDMCRTETVSCSVASTVSSSASSPRVIQPGATLNVGTNFTSISPSGKSAEVRYRLTTPGVVGLNPTGPFSVPNPAGSTSLSSYYTSVNLTPLQSVPAGSRTELRAEVFIDGALSCSTSTFIEIGSTFPWWQVSGGDIVAARGSIVSNVPMSPVAKTLFLTSRLGLPIFSESIIPSTRSSIGSPGWVVNSSFRGYSSPRGQNYNYNFFAQKFSPTATINSETITSSSYFDNNIGSIKDGYQVYMRNGPLSLGTLNFENNTSKKIIIFVNGEVNINGKILLDDGLDFFMIISRGNINVSNLVGDPGLVETPSTGSEDLEGIFVTDGEFVTNVGDYAPRQLIIRGVVVGWGRNGSVNGVNFQRNLGSSNSIYPSEIFKYAPDLILGFPSFFGEKSILWREVSP